MLRGTRTRAGLEVFKGCLEVRLELGLVSDFFECYGTQTRAGLGVFEGCGTRKRAGFGFFRMLWDSNPCWFGYFFCQIILQQQSKKIKQENQIEGTPSAKQENQIEGTPSASKKI